MLQVHRESGGFIPPVVAKRTSRYRGPVAPEDGTGVNSSSACLRAPREIHISDSAAYFTGVPKNDHIGRARLDLLNQGDAIPLGFTPWNPFSACLRAPREIHISDSAAYFTGVAKSDRIGADRLDLLNRGDAIPLGFNYSLSRYPIKLHQLTMRVELFYFAL